VSFCCEEIVYDAFKFLNSQTKAAGKPLQADWTLQIAMGQDLNNRQAGVLLMLRTEAA
jgi:hypothetical protein